MQKKSQAEKQRNGGKMRKLVKKAVVFLGISVLAVGVFAGCGKKEADKGTDKPENGSKVESNETGDDQAEGDQAEAKLKIGVSQLAEHPALDASYDGFVAALEEAGYLNGENIEIDFNNAQGDPSNCETIANKLVNDQSDLILAIATNAAQACAAKTTEIPILFTAVTDPVVAGLCDSVETPGTNVSGSSDLNPVKEQIDLLLQIIPDAKKIAIMYCSAEDNSIVQADLAKEACAAVNLEYMEATVSDSNQIQSVTESLIGKVDAIYIPTDNLLAEGMATVAMVANANHLPVIAGEENMVANGALATYGLDYFEIGKKAGEMAVDILKNGKDVSQMPVAYLSAENCELSINTVTAADLGITIPEDLLQDAKLLGAEE